jgi:capsid protein
MIVDQYGSPVKFAHAATRDIYRSPQYRNVDGDIDRLIPMHDRRTLASLSRRLYANMGVPRAAINQKADYSVGEAWLPTYTGTADREAGLAATSYMQNVLYPNSDIRGGMYDWQTQLRLTSVAIDRDGGEFILKTRDSSGTFPQFQAIPYHQVWSKDCVDNKPLEKGEYKGLLIRDGIIYNDAGRQVAYRVSTGENPEDYKDIPSWQIIHAMNPEWQEQGRGLPSFTHALEDLKHCLQSTEYERIRQMIVSSIGLIEHNENGSPDFDDPANERLCGIDEGGVMVERIGPGMNRYFTAGTGSKLEMVKHENPGEIWENFQDRMIRMSLIGIGWSYSMTWKPAGQGTAERAEVERARRAISARQKILKYVAKQKLIYAYSVLRESGLIGEVAAPFSWSFTMPPRLSIDDGREAQMMREGYKLGSINMGDIQEAQGTTLEEHYRERAEEIALRKVIANEVSARYGVPIEDREMCMLTPNEPAQPQTQESTTQSNEE